MMLSLAGHPNGCMQHYHHVLGSNLFNEVKNVKNKSVSPSPDHCSAVLTLLPGGRADQTDHWAPRHCKQMQYTLRETNTPPLLFRLLGG